MDPILRTDLVFNGLTILLDAVILLAARRTAVRSGWAVAIAGAFLALMAPATALAIGLVDLFGHRFFGVLRLFGMALFWHLPALMLALSLGACPRPARSILRAGAAGVLAVYLYSYHVEPRWLEVTHHEYSHPRLAVTEPVVIAQVSDIQTDEVGPYEAGIFEKLRDLDPDLVIYTGDYLHLDPDDPDGYRKTAPALRRLLIESAALPRYGSFAVLGDTEIGRPWEVLFEGTPVKILEDRSVTLAIGGAGVNLVGLSTETARGMARGRLMELLSPAGDPRFDLIVGHSPDFVMWLVERDRPFLALAGHTHGGQVRLPLVGPIITLSALPRKYADAFSPYGPGILSVSRGLGMERRDAPRLRFLCRPELRVITLHSSTTMPAS